MSVIRMSCVPVSGDLNYPAAVRENGSYVRSPFNEALGVGLMARAASHDSTLARDQMRLYLKGQLQFKLRQGLKGPVIACVHGFDYDSTADKRPETEMNENAHFQNFHLDDREQQLAIKLKNSSWPRGLGFTEANSGGAKGICLPFAWFSKGRFPYYAPAFAHADNAAWVLLNWLDIIQEELPGVPVDVICHSLGTRVVRRMIQYTTLERVGVKCLRRLGRIVMMGGAEFVEDCKFTMRNTAEALNGEAGGPVFYNINSRTDEVVHHLAQTFGAPPKGSRDVIGRHDLADESSEFADRWIDLTLDDERDQAILKKKGCTVIGDGSGFLDHWAYFTYRENMQLYEKILRTERDEWTIETLRQQGLGSKADKTDSSKNQDAPKAAKRSRARPS